MDEETRDRVKVAVAIRAARAAIGFNQVQFAELTGVSKPTIARAETLEMSLRAETYLKIQRTLNEIGVKLDVVGGPGVGVEIGPMAIDVLLEGMQNSEQRRTDRQKDGAGISKGKKS